MARFQRPTDGEEQRTTALELFFDLVFVFAVTQVSHLLLAHLAWAGAGQATLVLLAVWWAWHFTTWVTNELDPDSGVVRILLMALTLGEPHALGLDSPGVRRRASSSPGAYVAIQVRRHPFLAFVAADAGTIERERAIQISSGSSRGNALDRRRADQREAPAAVLWIAALAARLRRARW